MGDDDRPLLIVPHPHNPFIHNFSHRHKFGQHNIGDYDYDYDSVSNTMGKGLNVVVSLLFHF